jgi:citrate lyase subunit beta/citryl-CoA lyase
MRSLLFVSADDDAKLAEALDSGADGLCLDLADRVLAADKARARKNAGDLLYAAKAKARCPSLYVRVDGLDTAQIDADLDAVMSFAPDGVVPTGRLNGQALQHLGALLAVKEARCGLPDGSTRIIAGVGDAAASIFDMGSFAGASRRLAALFWSADALSAALGAERSRASDGLYTAPYVLARSLTLYAARAIDALAIDAACPRAPEGVGLRLECEAARRDGFDGKLALDRDQVEIINAVFTPTDEAIAMARAIIAAFAAEPEAATLAVDGEILVSSDFAQARRLLRRLREA